MFSNSTISRLNIYIKYHNPLIVYVKTIALTTKLNTRFSLCSIHTIYIFDI